MSQNTKTVIITGALGFIGSHTAKVFKRAGYRVVGIDRELTIPQGTQFLDALLKDDFVNITAQAAILENAEAIIHIAGTSLVGPSISNPYEYYDNNVSKTNKMLEDLHKLNWKGKIVFSSSAATYGNECAVPISENATQLPVSPYGYSKLMGEQLIDSYCRAYGMKGIALRYFNACGCDIDGDLGNVKNDTHLIPRIIESILTYDRFVMNGNDFNTRDGTCIRDYLHVLDIAHAHLEAVCLAETLHTGEFVAYNLGTGSGHSNLEIVKACEYVTDCHLNLRFGGRREGDPDELIANPNQFMNATGWKPKYSDLITIIKTTHSWMKKFDYSEEE